MEPNHCNLLQKIGEGDEDALRVLYLSTSPRLLSQAMRYVRRREVAEEVLQESFITIWRIAAEYKPTLSPPMAWMTLIVKSRALESIRKLKSRDMQFTEEFDSSVEYEGCSNMSDPASIFELKSGYGELTSCICLLDVRDRQIINLAYFGDLDRAEIAHTLGMPIGSVKTFLRRSLIRLRACLNVGSAVFEPQQRSALGVRRIKFK